MNAQSISTEKVTHKGKKTTYLGKPKAPKFLLKTYNILQKSEFGNIIFWSNNGNGFTIKNTKELEKRVLPVFFKHNRFTSFTRMLNMYGFKKIKFKDRSRYFWHPNFKKGYKDLLHLIKRKKPYQSSIEEQASQQITHCANGCSCSNFQNSICQGARSTEDSLGLEGFDGNITSIKKGVESFLSTLKRAMTEGTEKLSKGEKLKLEMSKRLFEEFAKVDSQRKEDNPGSNSRGALASSSFRNKVNGGDQAQSKEDTDSFLGKRSNDQISFSGDSIVNFDPDDDISNDFLNRSFEDVDFLCGRF